MTSLHIALASIGLACGLALVAAPAKAAGSLVDVVIIDRQDGRELPVYTRRGVHWIEGTPGHEYTIRLRNHSGGRVLAVTSVDGVNVISGETAAPSQSGYVLDAYGSTEIGGWRKSFSHTAAFYFTELPDSYAVRTGRPDNIGVIGVALFRERNQPVAMDRPRSKIAPVPDRADAPAANAEPAAGGRDEGASDRREELARSPVPSAQLGTGHGRSETSRAEQVAFERATTFPTETIIIRYDRRENLAALGIFAPPVIAHRPDPFPGSVRFTPDPPRY